jgi:hypothetical protein
LATQNQLTKGRADLCSRFSIKARREFSLSLGVFGRSSSLQIFQRRVQAMNHFVLARWIARDHEDVRHSYSKIDRFMAMDWNLPRRAAGQVIEDRAILAGTPPTQLVSRHSTIGQTREAARKYIPPFSAQLRGTIKLHANPISRCLSRIVDIHRPGGDKSRCFSARQQSIRAFGSYSGKDCLRVNARPWDIRHAGPP